MLPPPVTCILETVEEKCCQDAVPDDGGIVLLRVSCQAVDSPEVAGLVDKGAIIPAGVVSNTELGVGGLEEVAGLEEGGGLLEDRAELKEYSRACG